MTIAVQILEIVCLFVIGGLMLWYNTNAKLNERVSTYITEAEEVYKDTVKAGGMKHEYVVDKLYSLVPATMKGVFTREMISTIVDNAFTAIQAYAKQQLDRVVNENIK
jgi:hypothetical protein